MNARILSGKALGVVLVLAVGATFATVAHATDCYRYIKGDSTHIQINDSCVQQLGVTPIFVRTTDDGYDLLIPTSTEDTSAAPYMRFVASMDWLSEGTNLASTEAVVDAMVSDTDFVLPLGTSRIEQINYTLASWLNTSGATTSIASIADGSSPSAPDRWCQFISVCTSCEDFWCVPGTPTNPDAGYCSCDWHGTDCCVIGRRLEPPE